MPPRRRLAALCTVLLCLVLLFPSLLNAEDTPPAASTATLTVRINGLRNSKGQMLILLFNQPKGFPGEDKNAVQMLVIDLADHPAKASLTVTFRSLKPGVYAVGCLHDENKNGELDTKMFGIPKEGIGFSNDPRPRFRSPRYKESQFEVPAGNKTIDIKMWYM